MWLSQMEGEWTLLIGCQVMGYGEEKSKFKKRTDSIKEGGATLESGTH
jgi:hypothetical protein